jgi:hypothetical protein
MKIEYNQAIRWSKTTGHPDKGLVKPYNYDPSSDDVCGCGYDLCDHGQIDGENPGLPDQIVCPESVILRLTDGGKHIVISADAYEVITSERVE